MGAARMRVSASAGTRRSVVATRRLSRFLRGPRAVVVVAVVALGLGYWGFSRLPAENVSASDRAYQTLQLLGLQGSVPAEGTPWQLDVARFIAPLVLPYAALVALFAVAGGEAQRLRMRLFGRDHVLIVGIGTRGAALARSLRDSHHVVAMEIDAANGAALSLRKTGLPVLIGDARDRGALRLARPGRAAHVVLLAGDDTVNLEILAALRGLADTEQPVATHVALDAPGLWSELHRLPFQPGASSRRVDFVNIPDRSAGLLADAASGAGLVEDAKRILIHGAGPEAARLVVQLLRTEELLRASEDGEPLQLVLEGPSAQKCRRTLTRTDAWVLERTKLQVSEDDAGEHDVVLAFVCGLDEAEALEAAVSVRRRVPAAAAVFVAVPDSDTQFALEEIGVEFGVNLVATTTRILSDELFRDATFERIARRRHEAYLREERAKPDRPGGDADLVEWDELDEDWRRKNLRYADGVAEALAEIGAELAPLTGRAEGQLPLPQRALEHLAIREHNRWWRDSCRDGIVYGPTRTPGTRPSMKPWDQLDEEEREKDRESIRLLPRVMAEVGYEIVLPGEREIERRISAAPDPRLYRPEHPECSPPEPPAEAA